MAEPRANKLRRLEDFRRRIRHVSASALSSILSERDQLPDLGSRADIRDARDMVLNADTPYGPILKELMLEGAKGVMVPLLILCPFAMLWTVYYESEAFRCFFNECLDRFPNDYEHMWDMLLYSDEVVPGNQLSHDNHRKHWVIYYSFLQFGALLLTSEDLWLPGTTSSE